MTPRVSVAIPTYDGAAHIAACVESVLAQTLEDFELVVVDDASSDRTIEIVRGFDDDRIRVIENEERLGPEGNWNAALEHSRAPLVKILAQDDALRRECLERQVAALDDDPAALFIPFLITFVVLFATTGIGNGSTFRMIPIIFSKEHAGPVLGWTSAIAAYGAYPIPKIFATQIKAGTPEYALFGFAAYYASCLALNWWFYARKNAEIHC